MEATIQQWGDSLALRIPTALAKRTSVKKGLTVPLSVENGHRVIKSLRRPRKYSLKELVSKSTPANRHPETDWSSSATIEMLKRGKAVADLFSQPSGRRKALLGCTPSPYPVPADIDDPVEVVWGAVK